MTNRQLQSVRKRRVRRRTVIIAITVGLAAAYTSYRLYLSWQIRSKLDRIRAEGVPVTAAELKKWSGRPPSSQEGTCALTDVFSCININFGPLTFKDLPLVGEAILPDKSSPLDPKMTQAIRRCLQKNAAAMKLLHEGTTFELVRGPVDPFRGRDGVLSDLGRVRLVVKLLCLEAVLKAEEGDPEAVTHALITSLAVGSSLDWEPQLVFALVKIACQVISISSFERVINRTTFTDAQLVRLMNALERADDRQLLHRILIGERCFGYRYYNMSFREKAKFFDRPRTSRWGFLARLRAKIVPGAPAPRPPTGRPEGPGPVQRFLYDVSGASAKDYLLYLDLMSQRIESARLPLPQRLEIEKDIEQKTVELPESRVLCRHFAKSFERAFVLCALTRASLRAARVALAVERYRLANRKLPDTLPELVPSYLDAIPEDPFDEQPLRYRKTETGYIVYSIGADGQDNGGAERNEAGRTHGPGTDITFGHDERSMPNPR